MIPPIRPEATALVRRSISRSDRVLVTGAGGWFGLTIAALLHSIGADAMYLTQRPRTLDFGSGTVSAVAWDLETIREFAPTVVIDCAFILRDYVGDMSIESYVHDNTVLTGRLLQLIQLNSVRVAVTVSSGAAIHPGDSSAVEVDVNPYGFLKRQTELAALQLGTETGTTVVVARPWSLSGSLVTRPDRYAFSNLIVQARAGGVKIQAPHEVLRRYVGVDDFFAVVLALGERGGNAVLNSAGELVEFSALAERILGVLDLEVAIERPEPSTAAADDYYSRDSSWDDACASLGFEPATLEQQILSVDAYLRGA